MWVTWLPSAAETGLQARVGASSWWLIGLTRVVRLMKWATDWGAAPLVGPTVSGTSSDGLLWSMAEPLTVSKVTVRMELSNVRGRSVAVRWPTATGCRLVNWAWEWLVIGVTVMLVSPTELLGEGADGALGSVRTTT